MRFPAAAALALALLVPAAAAGAATKAPLVLTEKYADRFVFEPGFGWDTASVAKVKATFTVPLDAAFSGPESGTTRIAIYLGDIDFESTLGEADTYVPGRSASWIVLDDFTEKPYLKVKAAWKNGVLKVVVQVKGEAGAYSDFYVGEEDLSIPDASFDAELDFGFAEYLFDGTFAVAADTAVRSKAGDEYDISKVSVRGTAEVTSLPADEEAPYIEIYSPFPDDELYDTTATVDFAVSDETSISKVEYQVNGGPWTTLVVEVVIDPDFGDASVEGSFDVDTPSEGSYTVNLRATDAFDQTSTESVSFTVVFL